ncbi:MAG: urease accessory protein UreD [Thiohalocapsa sp.]|uniref:urease accessory protein UreD n=1 Tax=Thiohalocapsa sp. TaxID=2497641 RepID=UPI0025CE7493|nr:urease accessory protein UreD [Thiohalocapsa sp.]MCG6942922.1 urease accessory protein UreD [Thiohalocapsa sp.]
MGWRAELHLRCEQRSGSSGPRTVLARKHQLGPLTLQRAFHPEGAPCHLYPLHPPGGIVGGDELELRLDVATAAHVLVTTPGAAKFYRTAGGTARQDQLLSVAPGGVLEWLPQPGILFPGARAMTRTEIHLTADARFLGWEVLSLGRPVIGERFGHGALDAALRLLRDGRVRLSERLRVAGAADLDRPTGLRGMPVVGTLIATGAIAEDLDAARAALGRCAGALTGVTLLDDLLVARALADSTEPVQRLFCALWEALRPRVLGLTAVPPRIWAT